MVNLTLAAEMRRRLLQALREEQPPVTPTERRIWNLRQQWETTRDRQAYRDFGAVAGACPHAQTVVYRQMAMNGAAIIYLRCRSCDKNPLGVGVAIPHQIVRTCGIDPLSIAELAEHPAPEYDVCAHCQRRLPGEMHHFAPQSRFTDPDAWPAAYLCNDCHWLWHEVMGWGNEPWAKREEGA